MSRGEMREQLDQDVQAFLEKGNKIEQVGDGLVSWNTKGNASKTKKCRGWCGLHKPLAEFHSAKGYTSIRCKKCRAKDAIPES